MFDNAELPEDIEPLLPKGLSASGHVIIISRNNQLADLGQAQPVANLTKGEALALLAKHCKRQSQPGKAGHNQHGTVPGQPEHVTVGQEQGLDEEAGLAGLRGGNAGELTAARELVELLGYLALAITQAGAYIHATGCSVREYLVLFQKASISTELFTDTLARPKDYPATVGDLSL